MKGGKIVSLRRPSGDTSGFSDEALLGAAATGDAAAMGALIDRLQQPVYRLVGRLIGATDEDRDDLVQSTFMEVAASAAKFRGASSARVWIFGIAANLARNHIRSLVRRRRAEQALASVPPPASLGADVALERRELVERCAEAIAHLPHHLREAFVVCDLEELSGRDAAAVLGVREGTLGRRLHEARRALREALS